VATELRSLKRQNLREEALSSLRAAILSGELKPESIHSTTALADRLGVSPTPVREAMLELARQGLVEPLPNRGFRVVAAREADLDEIRDLRLMLEVPALALVIEHASEQDLEALRTHIVELDRAGKRGDLERFLTADRAFHLGLLTLGDHARLVRIVGELRDQTRILGLGSAASRASLKSAGPEHAAILDAVLARDVATAQRQMVEHLHHTRGIWAGQTEPDSWEEILAQHPWLTLATKE
jgi:DNA-binding GntR family transcriptional regulator